MSDPDGLSYDARNLRQALTLAGQGVVVGYGQLVSVLGWSQTINVRRRLESAAAELVGAGVPVTDVSGVGFRLSAPDA